MPYEMKHGTATMYRYGCRCDECKAAKAKQRAEYKARKKSGNFIPQKGKKRLPICEPLALCMARDFGITRAVIAGVFGCDATTITLRLNKLGYKPGKNSNNKRAEAAKREQRLSELQQEVHEAYSGKFTLTSFSRHRHIIRCNTCGETFNVQRLSKGIVCPECKRRAKEERKKQEREKREQERERLIAQRMSVAQVCEWCGKEFHAASARRFCSANCAERHAYRVKHPKVIKTCKLCGKQFESYSGKNVYCSNDCCKRANRANARRNGERTGNHRHRAHMYGVAYEPGITLRKVYERDGGVCYICGCKTNRNDSWHDENGYHVCGSTYPTIDHVVPMSKGGGHVWSNVRLACRQCNSAKGDRLLFEATWASQS